MEIQQHYGVVVEAAGISAGLRQAQREGEVSQEGEGGTRGLGAADLPPPLYIWVQGGRRPPEIPSQRGGGGQGGDLPPKSGGAPPHPQGFQP